MAGSSLEIVKGVVWTLVSLVVGAGMAQKDLTITGIPSTITVIAGWLVILGVIAGIVLTVFKR